MLPVEQAPWDARRLRPSEARKNGVHGPDPYIEVGGKRGAEMRWTPLDRALIPGCTLAVLQTPLDALTNLRTHKPPLNLD